ncbi:MAG: flagellar hook assembly protein FlgD [Shimia sp.]|nr:flagellar hook assembly protein FlgD [Shimia sp.]
MTDALSAISGTTAATTASTQSLSQLGEDYTRFLSLLTAQISNQDPLSPMDSTQFVTQLAQMTQVEQAVQTNGHLETLHTELAMLSINTGSEMVGRETSVASSLILLEGGVGETSYRLGDGVASVTASFVDPLGRTVRTISGLPTESDTDHTIDWDGLDDSGNAVLDGTYDVELTAMDENGNEMSHLMYRDATISEVLFHQGQLFFDVGGDEVVPTSSLLSLR